MDYTHKYGNRYMYGELNVYIPYEFDSYDAM